MSVVGIEQSAPSGLPRQSLSKKIAGQISGRVGALCRPDIAERCRYRHVAIKETGTLHSL
jgi:hypothetical protein